MAIQNLAVTGVTFPNAEIVYQRFTDRSSFFVKNIFVLFVFILLVMYYFANRLWRSTMFVIQCRNLRYHARPIVAKRSMSYVYTTWNCFSQLIDSVL